ncbi:hypothetical protein TSAR_004239 [Trichomalopsis sarcophagae]|uniref:Zinc transporter 1 n=1 Tax=Trichomalopsis sarcophagae TaxID=543379 RepID=A0A232EUX5_9HYME|nr:hypothetical protein TSAR_004239 [Trichomalopsis sarcophagae]
MAMKEWFRKLRPVQLYLVLFFTIAYFAVEIVAFYVSHTLTLLINAYHMLCNIVALIGCIASIKYENEGNKSHESSLASLKDSASSLDEKSLNQPATKKSKQSKSERRMKNTFGWARIDVVTMLICCVLLASFCFSTIVESVQTLLHIDHLDAMHYPLPIMSIGASGILLNAFCYFLIGGYTFNQGVFLHFTQNGEVVLKRSPNTESMSEGETDQTRRSPIVVPKSQGLREMCRDVLGCVLVMIASCLVYFTDSQVAKFVDPIIAIISAVSLFFISLPYMKESGLILLQTIPNHINIDSLQKDLLGAFPDIVNVHDLHVWQLNGEKVVSTVHIIYADPTVCARITDQITAFFNDMGITHVTIQPEFCKMKPHTGPHIDCLIRCQSKHCSASTCCSRDELLDDDHHHHHHHHHDHHHDHHIVSKKFGSKEILPADPSSVDLKRFTINVSDINETSSETGCVKRSISSSELTVEVSQKNDDNRRIVNVDIVENKATLEVLQTNDDELTITECNDDGEER